MTNWYWKDGSLATTADMDTDRKLWLEQMGEIEKKLCDPTYKIVKQTELPNGKWISTVWLGLDMNFLNTEKPVIFETMVFPKRGDYGELDQARYSTEEEALKGHEKLCKEWRFK